MEVLGSFVLFVFFFLASYAAQDTITVDQAIRDGETLVSTNEMYELGFFSPGRSRNRFLGIWYKNVSPQTVVWVANRDTPITDSSGVFKVETNGSLLVIAGTNHNVFWSSNNSLDSLTTITTPVAQLLGTGNLVVRDEYDEFFVWQSFDYPTDSFLPGMKLGKDLVSGLDRRFNSWKNVDDPSPGQYVMFMDTERFPKIFEENGSFTPSMMGPWNGVTFNGVLHEHLFTHEFVFNDEEAYYMYELVNSSDMMSRVYVSPEGNFLTMIWIKKFQKWSQYSNVNMDMCGGYGVCGPYGKCNMDDSPICSCMEGFEPQNPAKWNASKWSSGCRRRTPLDCPNGDGFQVVKNIKLPDTRRSWYNRSMTLGECAIACQRDCSCAAYANIEITKGGSGCLMWSGDLMDVRTVDESQDLYVKMAKSDLKVVLESTSESSSNKRRRIILASVSILSSLVIGILLFAILYAWSKKKRSLVNKQDEQPLRTIDKENSMEIHHDDTELPYFSLTRISKSTNDFSDDNKLGEGGFGPVYKGVLDDGREIAVKRLSKTSRQGLKEFKNELTFIAKLQHRNLVKLLGYCNQKDESMLIYEYMPNKSLDLFIFEINKSSILDWSKRFHIIQGIARGLLYLHQDSRFKIVHRDLKAGNILLDANLNTKISDFGLARMFREHENEANTNRVVGTLGYISPEYAVDGTFSEKSDVFSFGVIVLEIVSGRKNRGFSHETDSDINLLAHVWRLYEEGTALELLSAHMRDSKVDSEVLRSIHIGLLCVQHHAKDRPTMSSVILMFDQDGALPRPKQPAFFVKDRVPRDNSISVNDVTMTILGPR